MKIEKAEQAKELLEEIDRLKEIRKQTEKEKSHWWAFKSPDIKRENDGDGLYFPESLHREFPILIDKLINDCENKLKEL